MKTMVARQPIFNAEEEIYGYELLYRDGPENFFTGEVNGDTATSNVLSSSFWVMGIEKVTDGKRAFINFTENLLKDKVPTMFNNEIIIVEILENIEVSKELITACQELKAEGYLLALDDFVFSPEFIPLLKLADIMKVDFLNTSREEREKLMRVGEKTDVKLLAEKVETREEFDWGIKKGYSYFQGYFFSKPVILEGEDLPSYPANYLEAVNEIYKPEPNIDRVADIISRDVALSYKLLRLINSAAFMVRNEVTSIKNALVLLGIKEVEKWLHLMVIKELGEDKSTEVIRLSLIRAKFAGLIAEKTGQKEKKEEYFMMGLFSLMDVLMNRRLEKVLKELPIAKEIKRALLGMPGELRDVYELITAYEKGDWNKLSAYASKVGLPEETVGEVFVEAIEWCNEVLEDL